MAGADIKRLHYYQRQYLGAADLQAEQAYHLTMRRRHGIGPHQWGIVAGLEIAQEPNSQLWYLQPGVAVDGFGREIIVPEPEPLSLAAVAAQLAGASKPALLKVWLAYHLELSDRPGPGFAECGQQETYNRVRESFLLIYQDDPPFTWPPALPPNRRQPENPESWPRPYEILPDDPDQARWPLYLGTLTWDPDPNNPTANTIISVAAHDPRDNCRRHYLGVVAGELAVAGSELVIRRQGTAGPLTADPAQPDYAGIPVQVLGSLTVARQLTAEADLRVAGRTGLGLGTAAPEVRLQIDGGQEVAAANEAGYFLLGKTAGKNLVADNLSLQARNNQAPAPLRLQPLGGDLVVNSPQQGQGLVVTTAGQLGLGRDAPAARLDVAAGGVYIRQPASDDENGVSLEIGHRGNVDDGKPNGRLGFPGFGKQHGQIRWVPVQAGKKGRFEFIDSSAASPSGDYGPNPTYVSLRAQDGVFLGNLGVNTTNPVRRLQVEGSEIHSGGSGGGFSFSDRTGPGFVEQPGNGERWVWYANNSKAFLWSGTNKLTVTAAGYLGLGTSSPQRRLQVNGSEIHSGGNGAGFSFGNRESSSFIESPSQGERWVWYASNTRARLWSGTDKLTVTPTGNLGVGVDNPVKKLEINGSVRITGHLGTNGRDPDSGYPAGWGGGIHTWDLVADGSIMSPNKYFLIPHPLDPDHRYLIHSTLEGPEKAVFYRGEGQLRDGRAVISLPPYFEALTRQSGRTVLVTPKFEGVGPVSLLAVSPVVDGRFTVKAVTEGNPAQKFYWEVKAVRADVEPLVVEAARGSAPD